MEHHDQLSPRRLWNSLHQIQNVLGIQMDAMAEMMSLTEVDFLKMKMTGEEPRVTSTMGLTKSLNIGFDALMCGDIDYKTLARQYFGKLDSIPEKYSVGAFSRRRLAITLLDYVESRFGLERRALMLRRFQMNEAMLADPDAEINMCFGTDVIDLMYKIHQDETLITEMGEFSVISNRDSAVAEYLSTARTVSEIYEMVGEANSKFFEKNYQWKIKSLSRDGCTMSGQPNSELKGLFSERYRTNPVACLLRKGYFISYPIYAGFRPSIVTKTACVCDGDPECLYEIQFRQPSFEPESPAARA